MPTHHNQTQQTRHKRKQLYNLTDLKQMAEDRMHNPENTQHHHQKQEPVTLTPKTQNHLEETNHTTRTHPKHGHQKQAPRPLTSEIHHNDTRKMLAQPTTQKEQFSPPAPKDSDKN